MEESAGERKNRKSIHAYVSDEAHTEWHAEAKRRDRSVSALVEALGPSLGDVLDVFPGIDTRAGQVDIERKKRGKRDKG